jgi:hypothetical protein
MYTAVRHVGPGAFLERAETWLLEREDRHNLILSLAYGRVGSGDPDSETFFGTVEQGGRVVGCAMRTPPHKVLITDLPPASAVAVVSSLSAVYEEIPAVLGPAAGAEAVAVAWVAERGGGWRPGMEQRIYRLDAVTPPEGVPGALREATTDDIGLAVGWGKGFAQDAGAQFATTRDTIERWIERRSLFLWDDGQPRSITVAQGRTPNGIRVGYVYTPPESRGRGFASACVAEVSRRMLNTGLSFCVLYTDLTNPTSNAIYQRLGYDAIADVRDFDISRIASRAGQ